MEQVPDRYGESRIREFESWIDRTGWKQMTREMRYHVCIYLLRDRALTLEGAADVLLVPVTTVKNMRQQLVSDGILPAREAAGPEHPRSSPWRPRIPFQDRADPPLSPREPRLVHRARRASS